MKIHKIHVYLTLVLLALGFMIAYSVQFTKHAMNGISGFSDAQWEKKEQLQEKILEEQSQITMLEQQLQNVKQKVSNFEKDMSVRQSQGKEVLDELQEVRMWVGLVPVTGSGVVVSLNDSKTLPDTGSVNDYIVHEENIRQVVNELFAAGAEAISINGQRLTTNSAIRCVGPTVLVNEVKTVPPFEISAIGDSDTLDTALLMPKGIISNLKNFTKIDVKVEKKETLNLPAYTGDTKKQKAQKEDS
ncbi:MAG TPA: DUF881 domain-containing protein [Bacillota bacterium]|nr:DUF881 domain-containing protein [Bacillota bacterium]